MQDLTCKPATNNIAMWAENLVTVSPWSGCLLSTTAVKAIEQMDKSHNIKSTVVGNCACRGTRSRRSLSDQSCAIS